jgi:hypothetical protein
MNEFSKKFNAIVEDSINKFCSNNELFIGVSYFKIKDNFWKQVKGYNVIVGEKLLICRNKRSFVNL